MGKTRKTKEASMSDSCSSKWNKEYWGASPVWPSCYMRPKLRQQVWDLVCKAILNAMKEEEKQSKRKKKVD